MNDNVDYLIFSRRERAMVERFVCIVRRNGMRAFKRNHELDVLRTEN